MEEVATLWPKSAKSYFVLSVLLQVDAVCLAPKKALERQKAICIPFVLNDIRVWVPQGVSRDFLKTFFMMASVSNARCCRSETRFVWIWNVIHSVERTENSKESRTEPLTVKPRSEPPRMREREGRGDYWVRPLSGSEALLHTMKQVIAYVIKSLS